MDAGNKDLMTTPWVITKPWDGLCVTCVHHSYRHRSAPVGYEVHSAPFLTCKVRNVRSVVNGESSNWCGDIRADGAACPQWENDRACRRCVHARSQITGMECWHPSRVKKFDSDYGSNLSGKEYAPRCYPLDKDADSPPVCGKGAPDWQERAA